MQQAMFYNLRHSRSMAVAFLDLDCFKEINDTYGHVAGDNLLIHITSRMKSALRSDDTLARIGGDEFVIVLTDLSDPSDCVPILENVLELAMEPMDINGDIVRVSTSIGVTIYPRDDVDADQLLRHADHAMYLAKQSGKNCIHLFDVASDEAVKVQREEQARIKQALEKEEFIMFYQPKVNMQTGEVVGAEALIRWRHPDKGLLVPAAFLHVFEDQPLSIDLGEWVLTTVLTQIDSWRSEGLEMPVSVNIGAYQLQQKDFIQRLEKILSQFPNLKPKDLELEILETSALKDISEVSKIIKTCQRLGVDFALDDFGTGYSSLAYLKRLPAQILKIDQTFVRDMLEDKDDLAIIRGIIGLAKAFNRRVIAEGLETIAHGQKLLSLGCYMAQGYGIARPMAAQEILPWVETWRPDKKWLNTKP
jgi:diguanylate cyclase (GGDEF)-like protein